MTLYLEELTKQLNINDQGLKDIKKQIIESFGDETKLRALLNQQRLRQDAKECISCDDEGDCFILNGIIYLALDEIEHSIKELEHANRHLRNNDETWNSVLGLVLLGTALEENGQEHLAIHEYKRARETLSINYLRIHAHDYMEESQALEKDLCDKITKLSNPHVSTPPPSRTDSNPPTDDKDYLALFSIPIYGRVEAGPDGELFIDHFDTFTLVHKVEINGKNFDLHGIHGASSSDRQITVATTKNYGWLRVHGLSMNDWDLPFNENDYVLFYKNSVASHFDFVIASTRHPSGDFALIVKRFDEKNGQLLSKSKDTDNTYKPIKLDNDHQIIGIVVAVAKPFKQT